MPLHVDAASGGFVWPFLYPHSEWDFRLEQVRSINVSGHKFGLVYPGIGWLVFREKSDLPEDLVFYENYLGKRDATFTLNFSTGDSMVLAQYYNFVRFGHDGYRYIMETMKHNARNLAKEIEALRLRTRRHRGGGAAAAGGIQTQGRARLRRVRRRRAARAERGWMVPAYTLPPNAEHVKIMRVAREGDARRTARRATLGEDIAQACETLEKKGGTAPARPQAGQDQHRLLSRRRRARLSCARRSPSGRRGTR